MSIEMKPLFIGNEHLAIGIDYMKPYRKKPCLVLVEGNARMKLASFNDEESAELFMQKMREILEI